MTQALRLGIAGLGTVGAGLVRIVQDNADLLSARTGRDIVITAISARDKNRDRGVDLSSYEWVDNTAALAARDDVDVVVELIGGSEGTALDLVSAALTNGKDVVTANKALLAHHGYKLATLAEKNNVALTYEAAVAGGIPIIKGLREGLAANRITAVYGILNGTCNYILTVMRETGRDFDDVLAEAQELGYAETDPTFDVDGIDAGHKLAILGAIAFGVKPNFSDLKMTGIRQINATDIAFATELGYRIKLLGIAKNIDGKKVQVLEPCLVPESSELGAVDFATNAVYVAGDHIGQTLFTGPGAGAGPTASAVMADIVDLARGVKHPVFNIPASQLGSSDWDNLDDTQGLYYLRLNVIDKPGVIADVSAILRDHNISIESLIQRVRDPDQAVPLVMTTHETRHGDMMAAVTEIEKLAAIAEKPCLIRIEDL